MSNKSAVPIAAPKTLRYEQDAGLPVAIEARSNRRTFYPSNGEVFAPDGTNVIRMTLNSNSFVDFAHSYLQFKVTNKTLADGGGNVVNVAPDFGLPFFNRLQIMSGGTELEDIQEWSRLYATLQGVQGSIMNDNDIELTHNRQPGNALPDEGDGQDLTIAGEAAGNGNSKTYNVPLFSGIFNVDKYFPLLLTDQGLDLYFYVNPAVDIGTWTDPQGGAPATGFRYQISEFKYVAHEVILQDNFVNQMKQSMMATGGMLSMSSTTYRYYSYNKPANQVGRLTIPISVRVKSLKALLVRPQNVGLTGSALNHSQSVGQHMGITSAQFRIGSVLYPQSAIKFSRDPADRNLGEMYNEVRKAFGTLSSYSHGTSLDADTFGVNATCTVAASARGTDVSERFLIAYDFETFSKSATESGINVGDRALPVNLDLEIANVANTGQEAARFDIFAMCDCIIYIDLAGKVTTRI